MRLARSGGSGRRRPFTLRAASALEWLEMALRRRDPSLAELKSEPDLDPLRGLPRFQAIERELKFPQ